MNEKKWLNRICTIVEIVSNSDWEFLDDFSSNIDCNIASFNDFNNNWKKKFNNNYTFFDIEVNNSMISWKFDDIHESIFSKFNIVVARFTTLIVSKRNFLNREIFDMFSILNQSWCEIFHSWLHIFFIDICDERNLCINQNMIIKILDISFLFDIITLIICFELIIYFCYERVSKTLSQSWKKHVIRILTFANFTQDISIFICTYLFSF